MPEPAILACLFQQHEPRLVLLAAAICLFAAYTTLNLLARSADASISNARSSWLAAAAVALGCGIWSTHFVAMLGYRAHTVVEYDLARTAWSIVVAIFGSGLGLALAGSGRRPLPGGAVLGLSVGAMHYTGMAAMHIDGGIHYSRALVAASLAIGVACSAAALHVRAAHRGWRGRAGASALLAAGICGLHFTGMLALTLTPTNASATASIGAQAGLIAVAIAAVSVLILALSFGGSLIDEHLTKRNAQEAARLRESEARFRQLANAAFEGVFIHIGGQVVDANAALCRLVGRRLEEIVGHSILEHIAPPYCETVRERTSNPSAALLEIEILHADGRAIPVETLAQDIDYNGAPARVVAVRDLRERRQAERDLQYLAHHDSLTGLANRTLFNDRLSLALTAAERDKTSIAVLCIDLDRFKMANDLLGHRGGDELLKIVAQRLRDCVRAHDTIARIGGDEFAIAQSNAQAENIAYLAERLMTAIEQPYIVAEQQIQLSASIGIALSASDGTDCDGLVQASATALDRAKNDGRARYRFFEAATDSRLQERSRLEHDLRHALTANEQLDVHYQPLHDCETGELVGFEALLRWQHPERGFVSPADFIPIAEDCGLIVTLGEWVMNTACSAAARWPEHLRIAVNLSPAQFRQADLSSDILAILEHTGLQPHRLELEITEGVLIGDTERTLRTLTTLKAAGVNISLDDFGTGYSSLSYLQRFPFDKLKIDRSFVWDMEQSRDSMAIVRAVIALGHSLRISITAEGVETDTQLAILRSENCDNVQGYLLGKPQPLHQIEKLLSRQQRHLA